jgi:hypothetical protein
MIVLLSIALVTGSLPLGIAQSPSSAQDKFPFSIVKVDAYFSDYIWSERSGGGGTREGPVTYLRKVQVGYRYSLWIEVLATELAFSQDSLLAVHGKLPKGAPFVAIVHLDDLEETGTDLYTFVIEVETQLPGWADFLLVPANTPFQLNEYDYPKRSNKYGVELKDPAAENK